MSGQNVPSHYGVQYANLIQLLLQQKLSKLRPFVSIGFHKGEKASPVDQVAAIEMQEVVSRFAPMGRVDAELDRRWVYPSEFELPQLLDSFDEHKLLIDPKSKYVENAHAAANRKFDALVNTAFFAIAKTGKEGSTNTSFPSAQQVAVNHGSSGNSGLTVAKLQKAQQLLMAAEVDLEIEMPTVLITSDENNDLLNEYKIISKDFNSTPVLVDGKIKTFMGMNFIHYERLSTDDNSYRRVPVFVKSGMYLGIWQDMTTTISQRNDLSGLPWQAYVKLQAGATRLEEEKVVEIKCA
jgi:hypothetical protein